VTLGIGLERLLVGRRRNNLVEKEIPLEEAKKYIHEAMLKTGVVIKTPDYIYALYEREPNRWVNVSVILDEKTAWLSEVDTRRALLLLMDEVVKSLPQYKDKWKPIIDEAELEGILE